MVKYREHYGQNFSHTFSMGYEGGGGATFLTSDGFQIFFGALYHEMVLSSPEHKGSGNFEFLSCELMQIQENMFKSIAAHL